MNFVNRILIAIGFICFLGKGYSQTILRYSDHESYNEMRTRFLKEILFPAIEKESKGRIKIETFWNGELSSSYEALSKVSKGEVDIATIVPEYSAKELQKHQLFKSFLIGPTGRKQVAFFRKAYDEIPEFSQEVRSNNIEPIFLSTGYGVGFFSTDPINSLEDIKNKKWRTASFWHREFLKKYGAIPITIPWGEQVYKAFRERELNGIMVNIDGAYQLKIYEQVPYFLTSKKLWLGHLYIVGINQKTWGLLSQEDKNAIKRAAEKSYKKWGKIMDKSFVQQMKKLEEKGAKYRILSDKELKAFEDKIDSENIRKSWITEQNTGLNNILEKLYKILQK